MASATFMLPPVTCSGLSCVHSPARSKPHVLDGSGPGRQSEMQGGKPVRAGQYGIATKAFECEDLVDATQAYADELPSAARPHAKIRIENVCKRFMQQNAGLFTRKW